MFPDIKIVRIIGDFFGLECWFDRGLWSLNQRGIFEGADCDICVAVSVRSWMDVARGLEGRQLKWMRRKTGLRFFEHPPKLAPGLPRCPAASMISPCWHQGVLATTLTPFDTKPPSHWSVNFHPRESLTKIILNVLLSKRVWNESWNLFTALQSDLRMNCLY